MNGEKFTRGLKRKDCILRALKLKIDYCMFGDGWSILKATSETIDGCWTSYMNNKMKKLRLV